MADAFISYSRKDITFARRLHDGMQVRGFESWIDWKDIPPSADWKREIKEAIEQSDAFIVILSSHSVDSTTCSEEVTHAIENNKRLIPIVLGKLDPTTVPPQLAALNWIIVDPEGELDAALDILSDALRTDLLWVKAHTRYQNLALEWQRQDDGRAYLLRSRELAEAEDWIAQSVGKEPPPTALHNRFLLASRLAASHARRNQMLGVAAALILTLALGITALFQRSEAVSAAAVRSTAEADALAESASRATAEVLAIEEGFQRATAEANALEEEHEAQEQYAVASSRFLASEAMRNLDPQNLDLALLLSVAATQHSDTVEARESLLRTLSFRPHLLRILHLSNERHNNLPLGGDGLAFSPDGKMLASGGLYHSVTFWDLESGQILGDPLEGAESVVDVLAFSPDGTLLAAGEQESAVTIWRLPERKLLSRFELPDVESQLGAVSGLAFSPDGSFLIASDLRGPFTVWSTDDFSLIRKWVNPYYRPWAISLSPDSRTLASVHETDRVVLWDITTSEQIGEPLPFGAHTRSVAFSPDSRFVAAAGGRVALWDVTTGETIPSPLDEHTDISLLTLLVYKDPQENTDRIAVKIDSAIQVFDLQRQAWIGEPLPIDQQGQLARIAVSQDAQLLASNSGEGTVYVYALDPLLPELEYGSDFFSTLTLAELQARACRVANRNLTPQEWQSYLAGEPYAEICPELP
jgi:WD40 repeat protein